MHDLEDSRGTGSSSSGAVYRIPFFQEAPNMSFIALMFMFIAVSGLVSSGLGRVIQRMQHEDDYDLSTFPSTHTKEHTP